MEVDPDLLEALIYIIINAKETVRLPKEVQDELKEDHRNTLNLAVNILNEYKRSIGEEEIY